MYIEAINSIVDEIIEREELPQDVEALLTFLNQVFADTSGSMMPLGGIGIVMGCGDGNTRSYSYDLLKER